MNIDNILDEFEGKTKEELSPIAEQKLIKIKNSLDGVVKKANLDIDVDACVKIFIETLFAIDGRIDKSEYELYCKLMESISLTADSLEKLRGTANILATHDDTNNMALESIDTLLKVLSLGSTSGQEDFIYFCCALFECNGSIDSKELTILKRIENFDNNADEKFSTDSSNIEKTNQQQVEQVKENDVSIVSNENNVPIVKNKAGTMVSKDGSYYVTIGAEIANSNTNKVVKCDVVITVKSNDGRILKKDDNHIFIDSGKTFFYGTELYVGDNAPSNYTIDIRDIEFLTAPANSNFAGWIKYSHFNLEKKYDSLYFTGNIENTYQKDISDINSYFVFYDAGGKIVGGGNDFNSRVYANSEDNFQIELENQISIDRVGHSASFDFTDL